MKMSQYCYLEVRKLVQEAQYIAISFDGWTDRNKCSYLGVRGYLISDNDDYWSVCLEHFPNPGASADALADIVTRILTHKYKDVMQKIHYAVTDNCSTMISTVDKLKLVRIPCFCHVINLMVGDILEVIDISPLISFASAAARSAKFSEMLSNAQYKSLPTYSRTRWYSLYKLVRNSLADKEEIEKFISTERKAGRKVSDIPEETWEVAAKMEGILATF
jgi:hypothetical protein